MIQANVRSRLGRGDAQLVLRLVSGGHEDAYAAAERALADGGLDALLDDPRLLDGLLRARQGQCASLPLFCYVVVRHALRAAGEEDRRLADYAAAIVLHFGLRDRATRIGDADDETYTTLAELLAAAEGADPRRAFLVRAHLGNYALWLSGLFPDHVEHRRWRRGGPDLDYFEEMGRLGFRMAADHRLAGEYGLTALFAAMAERFPVLRVALTRVSDHLLFPHRHTPERLMRQVRDETTLRLAS
ncbi:MAG TPA: hypothetical protein VEZ47_03125 [Gemmatirosa sp.]|nr:hypothetical protein [Gemmatirosa sp.]